MNRPTPIESFDILYNLCSKDGRESVLFGNSVALVRPVVEKCLIGDDYPLFYVEFPLLGTPCFDVLTIYGELTPNVQFAPGCGFGYQEMYNWFSNLPSGHGTSCAIEMDTGSGETQHAGVYFQYRGKTGLIAPFLKSVGEEKRLSSYMDMLKRLPDGMPPAYIGLFPGREGSPMRIGGYMDRRLIPEIAERPALLGECFDSVGFRAYDESMLEYCREIFALAPGVDFQFDIFPDGSLGDVFGLSFSFNEILPRQAEECMKSGLGAKFMTLLEHRGLTDDRWKMIAGAALGKGMPFERSDGSFAILGIVVRFNYAKIKFKAGKAISAKFYLSMQTGEL